MLIDPYRFGGGRADDPFADDTVALVQYHTGSAVDLVGNTVEHVYGGNGSAQQVQGSIKAGEGPFGGAAWFNPNSDTNGGVRNYLRVVAPTSDPDRFIFPTDFTLEGWFRFPVTTASGEKAVFAGLVEPTDSGPINISVPVLVVNGATSSSVPLRCYQEYRGGGGSWFTQTNTSISASAGAPDTWRHVALTRLTGPFSTTKMTIWVDGQAAASDQNSTYNRTLNYLHSLFDDCSGFIVGSEVLGGAPRDDLYAYWDQIRVTKACRYTESFTPPAKPFWT